MSKSVDELPMKSEKSRARWGTALSIAVVVFSYIAAIAFVRGCVYR